LKKTTSYHYYHLAVAILWLLLAPSAWSADIEVANGYARESLPGAQSGAAYLRLINHSARNRVLVAAQSPQASKVEMHSHRNEGGMMAMRQVPEVVVPAQSKFDFQPGQYHFMLIGLQEALKVGGRFTLRLVFADGESLSVELPVRPVSAAHDVDGDSTAQQHHQAH